MKNYIAGLAAKVIELSREAEKWRNKYQQLKKDYDWLQLIPLLLYMLEFFFRLFFAFPDLIPGFFCISFFLIKRLYI